MGALDDDFEPGLAGIAEAAGRAGNAGEIGAGETEIFERGDRTDRCRPACGWNLRGAITGNLKLSDQAARSIG